MRTSTKLAWACAITFWPTYSISITDSSWNWPTILGAWTGGLGLAAFVWCVCYAFFGWLAKKVTPRTPRIPSPEEEAETERQVAELMKQKLEKNDGN